MTPQHQHLAARIAREADDAIKAALDRCAGPGWTYDQVAHRLSREVSGGYDHFLWDEVKVLTLGPVQFSHDQKGVQHVITATREVTYYESPKYPASAQEPSAQAAII